MAGWYQNSKALQFRAIAEFARYRQRSPRMLGFHDPDQRSTHSANAEMLGGTLQSRPPTLKSWTRNTGSEFTKGRAPSRTTPYSKGSPSCSDFNSWWPASRIPVGASCGVKDDIPDSRMYFLRTTGGSRQRATPHDAWKTVRRRANENGTMTLISNRRRIQQRRY